jgi:hypothetical protein
MDWVSTAVSPVFNVGPGWAWLSFRLAVGRGFLGYGGVGFRWSRNSLRRKCLHSVRLAAFLASPRRLWGSNVGAFSVAPALRSKSALAGSALKTWVFLGAVSSFRCLGLSGFGEGGGLCWAWL